MKGRREKDGEEWMKQRAHGKEERWGPRPRCNERNEGKRISRESQERGRGSEWIGTNDRGRRSERETQTNGTGRRSERWGKGEGNNS